MIGVIIDVFSMNLLANVLASLLMITFGHGYRFRFPRTAAAVICLSKEREYLATTRATKAIRQQVNPSATRSNAIEWNITLK